MTSVPSISYEREEGSYREGHSPREPSLSESKFLIDQFAGQTVDWNVLSDKFEDLFLTLSSPLVDIISEVERSRVRKNAELGLHAIIELAQAEVHRLLAIGENQLALEGAKKTLHFSQTLFSSNCEELIRSQMLLARCFYHLGKFRKAEEFYSLANWRLLKLGLDLFHIRVELHTGYGLLFIQMQQFDKALSELSNAIYYQSRLRGPRDPSTAVQYYHLAQAFLVQNRIDEVEGIFDTIISIFRDALSVSDPHDRAGHFEGQEPSFCLDLLLSIARSRESSLGEFDRRTGNVYHVLGLMYAFLSEMENAVSYLEHAHHVISHSLGPDHPESLLLLHQYKEISGSSAESERISLEEFSSRSTSTGEAIRRVEDSKNGVIHEEYDVSFRPDDTMDVRF